MLMHERLALLRRMPILVGISVAAAEGLARTSSWRTYKGGQQILEHLDLSTDVFFLLVGKVRVITYSPEGKSVIFADLKAGSVFGEIAAIDGRPRSAGIEALEPCTVVSLTAEKFQDLLQREPAVALSVLRQLTSEVRRLSERVFEYSTLVVRHRVHAELFRLAREASAHDGMVVLSPAPTLADIADRISTHREAVSRELSRLSRDGLIRREGADLIITDVARLVVIASSDDSN